MTSEPVVTLVEAPARADLDALMDGLHAFNTRRADGDGRTLTVLLRDAGGRLLGGLHGWTAFHYFHVDVLWLAEEARGRGHGTRLMRVAEDEARRRGCRYGQLDTFSFQAPGFYERLGYRSYATLDGVANGASWHFMRKELT